MKHSSPRDGVRLLVVMNPGRVSRRYVTGMLSAAERAGIVAGSFEVHELWAAMEKAGPQRAAAQRALAGQLTQFVEQAGVTHVLSYAQNGVFDFGIAPDRDGREAGLFARLGLTHILVWTDHPNWAVEGSSLEPPFRGVLSHPGYHHIVKSGSAAEELREVAHWRDVAGMPMGEAVESWAPATGRIAPAHDAVVIMTDATPIPAPLVEFLAHEDPEPAEMMNALRGSVMGGVVQTLNGLDAGDAIADACMMLADEWIDRRIARPDDSFWRLSRALEPRHAEAIAWLRGDARRWYAVLRAMQGLTRWRRFFWPAWLGRRMNVGLYGSDGSMMGLSGGGWVDYDRQAEAYALGRCALNINAAHDEEGLTHKPFQIAASGVPLVHHATNGIELAFTLGREALIFERGPELIEGVQRAARERTVIGEAGRSRVERDHTWDARLGDMLSAWPKAQVRAA